MKKLYKLLLLALFALVMAGCGKNNKNIHPSWSYNAVMYELNIRQFTDEGTFAAAEEHLPRLRELGVDIIWFMPIQPIGIKERKGELGSYYSVSDYTAVNPEFGTMDDFRGFVSAAHGMGFKVIIDWVPNHTSRDAKWLETDKSWYVLGEDGEPEAPYDWTDVAKLNYGNHEMRRAMTDAMLFWIKEADIDGFRCDVAGEVPTDFWKKTIAELKKQKKDIFMLAEAEKPELHTLGGFDASYAWELHHIMNMMAQEKYTPDSLRSYLAREKTRHPRDAFRLTFTSNHDENSWNGTEFERMGDAANTFAAFSYVVPGMPLIYNGQEVGFDRRLEFFTKDRIDWRDRGGYTAFFRRLNDLKHKNPALAAGEKGGGLVEIPNTKPAQVFSFVREAESNRVIGIFNFSAETVDVTVSFGDNAGSYLSTMTDSAAILRKEGEYTLIPWGYVIYEN